MPTNEDIFDRACRQMGMGHREDIENYPDVPAAPVYQQIRHIARELIDSAHSKLPTLLPIHFDFIHEPKINACAFRVDNTYFIGLTVGAMAMPRLVFDRMLASTLTFPTIGDQTVEDSSLPPVPWNIIDAEKLYTRGVRPILPRDIARRFYAQHLAQHAIMFLIGHEIAHITLGHIDYAANAGSRFLVELGWKGDEKGRIERQAIELDADARSVYARCHSAIDTDKHADGRFPPWATAPLTSDQWQFDWAFAVNTLFRLFGDRRFSGSELSEESYPPLPLRRKLAMDVAERTLVEQWGLERTAKIHDMLVSSIDLTESSFSAIGADPGDGGFSVAHTQVARAHIERLSNCWLSLKPMLKPFAYEF